MPLAPAQGDTDARADVQRVMVVVNRLMQAVEQALAKPVDFRVAVHAMEHQHELVAPSRATRSISRVLAQTGGDFQQ